MAMDKKGLIRYLRSNHAQLVKVSKMTTTFLTFSESVKWLPHFGLVQIQWFKRKFQSFSVRLSHKFNVRF